MKWLLFFLLLPASVTAVDNETIREEMAACDSDEVPSVCVGLVLLKAFKRQVDTGTIYCKCTRTSGGSSFGDVGRYGLFRVAPPPLYTEKLMDDLTPSQCGMYLSIPQCQDSYYRP